MLQCWPKIELATKWAIRKCRFVEQFTTRTWKKDRDGTKDCRKLSQNRINSWGGGCVSRLIKYLNAWNVHAPPRLLLQVINCIHEWQIMWEINWHISIMCVCVWMNWWSLHFFDIDICGDKGEVYSAIKSCYLRWSAWRANKHVGGPFSNVALVNLSISWCDFIFGSLYGAGC